MVNSHTSYATYSGHMQPGSAVVKSAHNGRVPNCFPLLSPSGDAYLKPLCRMEQGECMMNFRVPGSLCTNSIKFLRRPSDFPQTLGPSNRNATTLPDDTRSVSTEYVPEMSVKPNPFFKPAFQMMTVYD